MISSKSSNHLAFLVSYEIMSSQLSCHCFSFSWTLFSYNFLLVVFKLNFYNDLVVGHHHIIIRWQVLLQNSGFHLWILLSNHRTFQACIKTPRITWFDHLIIFHFLLFFDCPFQCQFVDIVFKRETLLSKNQRNKTD